MCETNFAAAVGLLKAARRSTPWTERLRLARQAAEALAARQMNPPLKQLVALLAEDPKWEVRAMAAEMAVYLPDEQYAEIILPLASDVNQRVSMAARQTMQRRRQAVQHLSRERQATTVIARQLRAFENRYGVEAMRRAMRLCDRYGEIVVAAMVHDLRSLITAISSDGLTLIQHYGNRRRVSVRFRQAVRLLEQTASNMQAFTQELPGERRREWLDELVRAAVQLAQSNVRRRRLDPEVVAVAIEITQPVQIEVARHLIVMALANVVTNAFEAILGCDPPTENGRVDIRARRLGNRIRIMITDNGPGVPEQLAGKRQLFIPGRRNKTKRYGTGFGLAIAQRYLAAHGGTIELAGGPSKGTTVTIHLPIEAQQEAKYHETESIGC